MIAHQAKMPTPVPFRAGPSACDTWILPRGPGGEAVFGWEEQSGWAQAPRACGSRPESCRGSAVEDQDVAVGMAVAAEGAVVTVMVSAAGSTAGPGPSGMAVWTVLAVLAVLATTAAARCAPTASAGTAGTASAAATAEDCSACWDAERTGRPDGADTGWLMLPGA